MNYDTIYNKLIARAIDRNLQEYTELHHIVPRCMGGTDEKANLVRLLPEEHYIAHLLLMKIFPDVAKLVYAANMMASRTNKSYGWLKRKFADRLRIDRKGQKHTPEARMKMSKARQGIPKDDDWKRLMQTIKTHQLEYKGNIYNGYKDLKDSVGVSRHLYLKFYLKGIDPDPYIGNRSYGMVAKAKVNHPAPASGKRWYNNGIIERYMADGLDGWILGRLSTVRDQKGRYIKRDTVGL